MMKNSFVILVGLAAVLLATVGYCADCQQMGSAVMKERNFMKRIQLVEDAYVACPDDSVVVFMYAFNKERNGQLQEALIHYTRATTLDPEMSKAWFGMADILVELSQKNKAILAYDKGLVFDPTNVRAIRSKSALHGHVARK